MKLRVVCSKGTYIRTLCSDIGQKLGCGGAMQSLQRTKVGRFRLEDALTLGELQQLKDSGELERVVQPVDSLFEETPALHVTAEAARLLENGNALLSVQFAETVTPEPERWVRVYRPDGRFAGIYAYEEQKRWYRPVKMFL